MGFPFCYRFSLWHLHDNPARGPQLVQNGNLPTLAQLSDLCRRVPYPLFERSGQMRLIEIACLVNSAGDRFASLQEGYRPLGAFDLTDATLCQLSGPQETVP